MAYNPREIEDAKQKQREATGNIYGTGRGLFEAPLEKIEPREGLEIKRLPSIEYLGIDEDDYVGDTGDIGDTGIPQRALDPSETDIDEINYALGQDALGRLGGDLQGSLETELERAEQSGATDNEHYDAVVAALAKLRREAPHVKDIETPKLEPKSASTTAPHYATTWSIGQVDAPVLPDFKAPKTLTWTDATGTTTESPLWSDVWEMNQMFDPNDITATLNIQGKPHSVQVGTRFTNGDEVTDIELAPIRVGPGKGQEVGVWRIRMTPEGEDVQDYFVYSEDVDASQIIEGGEAATSRASEKVAAHKKAEADAAAAAAATRDDLLAEVIPGGLETDLPGGSVRGDLRYRKNVLNAYVNTLHAFGDEQEALDAAHGARNASAVADLEKWSAEVGVKSVTSRDGPFTRTTLNDGQVYIESPEGDVYNISALSDQEVDKFYVDTYDDTAWQKN